jgi:hypothetical protein
MRIGFLEIIICFGLFALIGVGALIMWLFGSGGKSGD